MRRLILPILIFALAGCSDKGGTPLAPDRTPPAVVAVTPAEGAVGVPDSAALEVEFDEPVAIDDTASALVVRSALGLIPGDVALDSTATRLTFAPSIPFAAATDFTLTLAAGIADRSGNARPDSLVTRFSTALAFYSIGRVFSANQRSRDLSVLDLLTYEPVAGSPVALGVSPLRLRADAGAGLVYVLYAASPGGAAGVLVVDGRSLAVLRDSGPVLPGDAADLALSPEHGLVLVVAPGAGTLHKLEAATLAVAQGPIAFDRADASPVRVEVARSLGYALVALDGGARLAALRLPDLVPVPGFPARSAPRAHTIQVDEARSKAWVGGAQRYAVVDLVNPSRTTTLQMPVSCDPGGDRSCATPRLWSMILDPVNDRTYFIDRYDWVFAVVTSNLEPAPESPGRLRGFHVLGDLAQDPRTGNLILLGWRNTETPTLLVDRRSLFQVRRPMPELGLNALDLEVLP